MSGLDRPLTPLRYLERSASVYPGKEAVIDGPRRFTYEQLAAAVTRTAHALRASGVDEGDRVIYLAANSAEMVMAHFAVPLARAVLVATNTRLAGPEIAYIAEHSGARLILADGEIAERHRDILAATGVELVILPDIEGNDATQEGATTWSQFLERGSNDPIPWTVDDETRTITLNYTSGTTGRPKGVMYSHRGAYLNSLGECLTQGFDRSTRYLWTLPLFHCNGWCCAWAVVAAGGTQVCLRAVRGDDLWRLVHEEGIDHLCGAPTVLSIMADAEEAAPLTTPLTVVTAGAPPSPTIIERLQGLNTEVIHVYGLTETYGPYGVCEWQDDWADLPPAEVAVKLARQGVGMVTAEEMRVVQTEGSDELVDVPSDGVTVGEIVMAGNGVMKGYFRDDAATAEAFRGGWFHSGDLGVRHPDGYVQLVDRAKDVVISGGENISTVEVEQAILRHEAVSEVAVIGIPDERWGERPMAYVVVRPGATVTSEELIAHTKSLLASYKVPKAVDITEDLPKTATGKIRKHELKAAAWEGRDSKIQG